jgi:hypothetical protein
LPAVPAPHAGTSYNPPEAAHTELLRAAHEAELRRVQEAEALEAMKARILSARHAGGGGDGGAPGMLIDKPGEGVEEQEEQEDSIPTDQSEDGLDATAKTTKSVPQRKTKQQRRKAEKLRAEVCGLNLPSPLLLLKCEKHYSRNMPSCSAPCGNGCMRLSTVSRPYAKLLTGRERHECRRRRSGAPSRKRALR